MKHAVFGGELRQQFKAQLDYQTKFNSHPPREKMMEMILEIYRISASKRSKTKGTWRWRLKGMNNKIVGASSEAFTRREKALSNLWLCTGVSVPLNNPTSRWSVRRPIDNAPLISMLPDHPGPNSSKVSLAEAVRGP